MKRRTLLGDDYKRDVVLTLRIAADVERRMRKSDEADKEWERQNKTRQLTFWEN